MALEGQEIDSMMEQKQLQFLILSQETQRQIEWEQHLACSKLPNPEIERDFNSYLTLLSQENLSNDGIPSMEKFLSLLESTQQICTNLEDHLAKANDQQDSKNLSRLQLHLKELDRIINSKCDSLTADILQHMDSFKQEANENFQVHAQGIDYSICLWGNITKNPRFKVIEFEKERMSASLPKALALSNVAIRMIYESNAKFATLYEEPHFRSRVHMRAIGGVLFLDLVELPEMPKSIENWTIRPSMLHQY